MRNYIILNGTPSTWITGLLIQELPPITKPPRRYNATEINGVDGDRIEDLGYGSYDREMLIGLHGDFDIDAVISYFDSAGEVIFSNEPDKIYHYEILEQIDFTRLLRFREATVVFHVQPFKYSATEHRILTATNQIIQIPNQDSTVNGLHVVVDSGVISVYGWNNYPAEVFIPIQPAILHDGRYNLTISMQDDGNYGNDAALRLLDGPPIDAHSFGEREVMLRAGTNTVTAEITGRRTFTNLYLMIPPNQMSCTITVSMEAAEPTYIIRNSGNRVAKPVWTIYGNGNITLILNGARALVVQMGDTDHLTIDCDTMDAYIDTKANLANRRCSGDYEDLYLTPGQNVLTWEGQVDKITIENYSRWT